LRVRGDQVDRLVDPVGGAGVAGCVAGPVDQVKHLFGVGQRHDQRRVSPDALVGDVHPGLVLPTGWGDGAVGVEVGDRTQQVPAAPGPQFRAHRVDRIHQRRHVGLVEPPAEITGRGRVRDQFRTKRVHVGSVVAQPFDVLEPGATTQYVVAMFNVIGLVIGQVHLQQLQPLVDLLDQPDPRPQPVHRGDPTEAGRVHVRADLVAHLP